jgi:hypothetical protein
MNTALPPLHQTSLSLFLDTQPPKPRRRCRFTLDEDIYNEVLEVAQLEGMGVHDAINSLLGFALRYYKFKKGTLNESKPENTKTFYCQVCGQLTSMRRVHRVQMLYEEYQFCEPCFFADRYKTFIIQMLNRV